MSRTPTPDDGPDGEDFSDGPADVDLLGALEAKLRRAEARRAEAKRRARASDDEPASPEYDSTMSTEHPDAQRDERAGHDIAVPALEAIRMDLITQLSDPGCEISGTHAAGLASAILSIDQVIHANYSRRSRRAETRVGYAGKKIQGATIVNHLAHELQKGVA